MSLRQSGVGIPEEVDPNLVVGDTEPQASRVKASMAQAVRGVFTDDTTGRASIAPGRRPLIIVVMAAVDLAGVAVALALLAPEGAITSYVVRATLVLGLAGQFAALCGFYSAASSSDLRRSALGVGSLITIAIPLSCLTWLTGYGATIGHDLASVAVGLSVGLIGRVICSIAVCQWVERITERVLIIGAAGPAKALAKLGRVADERVRIIGQIVVENRRENLTNAPIPAVSTSVDASSLSAVIAHHLDCLTHAIDRVVIAKLGLDDEQLDDILHALDGLSAPIHIIAGAVTAMSSGQATWVIRGMPANTGAMMAKRAFDISASLILLTVILPFLLITALLIRLESPGPALFRQTRLGRDNKPFTVLKLRTMRSNSPATDGSMQAVRGDARITRLGAILRKTSVDELPQLLNVFNGSMSLVGPRPHPVELNRRFVGLIELYSSRHRMAPGITGWAQVNGFRGETRTTEQMQRRVELDLEYIRGHSLIWDLWILLRTVVSVLDTRSVY